MADDVGAERCVAVGAGRQVLDGYPSREVHFGSLRVTRALPIRERRLVGPWCFLDRFGPIAFTDAKPMDVAPHPHIGLQTVTWLVDGEILHDDSLGSEVVGRPGGVDVMTAAAGIAHAEQTPLEHSGRLEGVQLWVALPNADREGQPGFEAVDRVPAVEHPEGIIQVFAGSLAGATSPARHFSDLVGADLAVHPGRVLEVDLEPTHEHAVLVLAGDCAVDGQLLDDRHLYYLGTTRTSIALRSRGGARVLLIGGPPFPEPILIWWNFVARTPEEIARARADWEAGERFGPVRAYRGSRIPAPELARFATPNPVS